MSMGPMSMFPLNVVFFQLLPIVGKESMEHLGYLGVINGVLKLHLQRVITNPLISGHEQVIYKLHLSTQFGER